MGGAGSIYVADANNHRVQVFDANGMILRAWGAKAQGRESSIYPPM